ncbi:MAG: tetratricopeptide repeat protein [Spirochaetaceae bacterium]|nr:tetratricopeptide repeat protein [Spirochaetaceae bacterium]
MIHQLINTETTVPGLIQKAYDSLKASDAHAALAALESALEIDYKDQEVVYALKCLNWWLDRVKQLPALNDSYEQGGFILSQWKAFYGFIDKIGEQYDPCQYALRRFVFSTALQSFQGVLSDGINEHDPGLLLQVGRCYKGVGNYDLALKYLEQAFNFRREDGETLSELADVNALLEESRAAKVLFREAFFLDPQSIDLRSMESEMITRLCNRVRSYGYEGIELAEWIPIYGSLFGVFSVRRELKSVEVGRLKQAIFSLENEIRSGEGNILILKPRLINRYFWLIDHYENVREDPSMIEETMLKIKIIDPVIYERYRN